MIVDGRRLEETLFEALTKERIAGGAVALGILVGNENPVTASYVRIKARAAKRLGVEMKFRTLSKAATTGEAISFITELTNECDGIIPQLPLPAGIDLDAVRNSIPKEKDIDILSEAAYVEFEKGNWKIVPPVPAALAYILEHHHYDVRGKKVVIIGQGRLVGKPSAVLFKQLGAHVISLEKGADVVKETIDADVIILGAGVPGLLTADMIKAGAVVLDAGTSELGEKIVGDANPSIAEKCALFTPVPGGVGPIAIAMIFRNLFQLVDIRKMRVV